MIHDSIFLPALTYYMECLLELSGTVSMDLDKLFWRISCFTSWFTTRRVSMSLWPHLQNLIVRYAHIDSGVWTFVDSKVKRNFVTHQSVKQGTFINVLLLIREGIVSSQKRNFFHHFHFIERLGKIFKMTKNKGRSKSTLSFESRGEKCYYYYY